MKFIANNECQNPHMSIEPAIINIKSLKVQEERIIPNPNLRPTISYWVFFLKLKLVGIKYAEITTRGENFLTLLFRKTR
jgi:hypothetical protein